jgi:hypothetical protein
MMIHPTMSAAARGALRGQSQGLDLARGKKRNNVETAHYRFGPVRAIDANHAGARLRAVCLATAR